MSSYLLNLLLLGCVVLPLVFWWKTQGLKQIALRAVLRRCDELGLQLLDQSIMLRGIRFSRDSSSGRLSLVRRFVFEFSSTGNDRYRGEVDMVGQQVVTLTLEPHRI